MNLYFVTALEKRVALFSYSSSGSVENIVYFYFVWDLAIGFHYLPSPIQHALHEVQMFEQTNFEALCFLYGRSVKKSCIFTSLGTLLLVCTMGVASHVRGNQSASKHGWRTFLYSAMRRSGMQWQHWARAAP